jgi:hypothetical protein
MTAPKSSLVRRSLRRFALGSGPLKRRSDRLQMIGRLVVALSFLAAPPLAVAATNSATANLQAVAAVQAAERSHTVAVLLENAPAPSRASSDYGGYAPMTVSAPAVWSLPDGTTRHGIVLVQPLTSHGTKVPVWIDREGALTRAPLTPAGAASSAAVTGALPLFGVPLATWTLYAILCFALDAHRERRWAEDWAAVEPRWNSRLL